MKENVIKNKSFAFALRIIKAYQFLSEKKEFVLSKQMRRSECSMDNCQLPIINYQLMTNLILELI